MFRLIVQFFPRKDNGNVCWDAEPIFWEETFDELPPAKKAFMESIPFNRATNAFVQCNLRGKLIDEKNNIVNDGGHTYNWDWTTAEKKEENFRSDFISKWLDNLEKQGREGEGAIIDSNRVKDGLSIVDLLIEMKLCQSKNDARRQLTGGGIKLNNEKILEPRNVTLDDFKDGSCTLSKGKKEKKKISLA